jgi:hypothetical protein
MSQTKNELEAELKEFKDTHTDWMKVEWKANVVNGYNVRLTTFQPTGNLPLTSDPLVVILILPISVVLSLAIHAMGFILFAFFQSCGACFCTTWYISFGDFDPTF